MKLPCPIDDCPNHRPAEHAMCRRCWGRVPRGLQQAVYKAWRERLRDYPGSNARHAQAIEDACAAVENRAPKELLADA